MKNRCKFFQILYFTVLAAFLAVGAELAVRLSVMQDGMDFYKNIGAAGQGGLSDEQCGRLSDLQDATENVQDTDVTDGLRNGQDTSVSEHSGNVQDIDVTDSSVSGQNTDVADVPENVQNSPIFKEDERDRFMELSAKVSNLSKRYADLAAWIQIPGTMVDYPVMLGSDNSFYLDHLPDGSKNALGSLFFDFRCSAKEYHWIIYGHNGSGGRMFGQLKNYMVESYYESHRPVVLAAADALYFGRIFSVSRVSAGSSVYAVGIGSSDALENYISRAAAASLYQTDDVWQNSPLRVLTLSTCTGWGNQRLIVQALLYEKIQLSDAETIFS